MGTNQTDTQKAGLRNKLCDTLLKNRFVNTKSDRYTADGNTDESLARSFKNNFATDTESDRHTER